MFPWIAQNRIPLLRVIACLFFVFGILLSFPAWHSDRLFPMLPVYDGIPQFPADLSRSMAVLLTLGLLIGSFMRFRSYFIAFLVFALFFLLQDQERWQPWVYIYCAILLPFALWKRPDAQLLTYFQILLIGVYLWSGVYKFSGAFIELTFDKMLRTLLFIENEETRQSLHFLGYGIPITEVLIAIGLFFRRSRTLAILGAVLSHSVILTYLLVNDQNTVVYPWNIAMVLMVIAAFYRTENTLAFWKETGVRIRVQSAVGAVFFIFLPVLNPIGLWDNYLSFKLYSGNNGYYCVGLDMDQYQKVDSELHQYFWRVEEPNGKYWILLNKWAFDELNVPFYPEIRTLKKVAKTFCDGEIPKEKLEFVKFQEDFSREREVVFDCEACK